MSLWSFFYRGVPTTAHIARFATDMTTKQIFVSHSSGRESYSIRIGIEIRARIIRCKSPLKFTLGGISHPLRQEMFEQQRCWTLDQAIDFIQALEMVMKHPTVNATGFDILQQTTKGRHSGSVNLAIELCGSKW